jgi:hypothetical protein
VHIALVRCGASSRRLFREMRTMFCGHCTYRQARHNGAFGWSYDKLYCGRLAGVDFDNRSYAWGAIVNQDDLVYAAFELN